MYNNESWKKREREDSSSSAGGIGTSSYNTETNWKHYDPVSTPTPGLAQGAQPCIPESGSRRRSDDSSSTTTTTTRVLIELDDRSSPIHFKAHQSYHKHRKSTYHETNTAAAQSPYHQHQQAEGIINWSLAHIYTSVHQNKPPNSTGSKVMHVTHLPTPSHS